MGNLLKLLSREDCPKYDVFVDFESKSVLVFLIYNIFLLKYD